MKHPTTLESLVQNVSRAQLDRPDTENETEITPVPDLPILAKRLHDLVAEELGDPTMVLKEMASKRRKLDTSADLVEVEEVVPIVHAPFLLLSSWVTPQQVILDPKPPPPVSSTEPDVQDNKVQAEQRKKWSNLAAVDNDWIHAESRKNYPPSKITQGRLISVKETSPLSLSSAPALLVTETQQHTRRSRPPVSAASPGAALALSVCAGIPVVSVHLSEEVGGRAHRSRHRRGKRPSKDVTQPTFWKPDPTLKGKSSGYALGYPGNWLALAARSKRYERDTMKKGIFTSEPSVMTSL
ncbi:hypothetical protein HWV62_3424 [Athelia sp. TMB]|nr:hypothetical protein HWV62_3424 [Athelia sp. TMB]